MAYWDSSAAATLCVTERATGVAKRVLRVDPHLVTWWGSSVEIASALARLAREETLDAASHRRAASRLAVLRQRWSEILPTDRVRGLAESLLSVHPLRAGDAFQLAAALVWARERPRHRAFICFDARLAKVAARVGFEVVGP